MNVPVIMTLVDDNVATIVNGITNGACDYLLKPVKFEELKKIWQHVVRKSLQHPIEEMMESVSPVKRNISEQTKIQEENVCKSSKKKNSRAPRIFWDPELQNKFIHAVQSLGLQSATPKKIMEIMNIPGLSTRQISSHLQKTKGVTLLSEIQQNRELDQTKCYSSSTTPNAFASPSFISETVQELTSADKFKLVDVGECSTVNNESEEYASLGFRSSASMEDFYAAVKMDPNCDCCLHCMQHVWYGNLYNKGNGMESKLWRMEDICSTMYLRKHGSKWKWK
ncbi:Two-component response regulator ARR14 [Acorus calamus]|uniref:Two-component response regulator ARR14 n=1 Tax=Acorus calamus TaxID=4465 RepID=A0AAV9BZP7_ACOCL|nr:Two-component response regulator ARR14 [Acorus calamus]